MPKPGGWIELSHVCPWLHWLGKLCQTTCFKHQKHGDDYSQIDNESAGCRDAMIAMGLLVVQLTAPRPAATMKTWKTSQSTLKSWGPPRNVQNHGWRGSEQFEENWWWNMQLFMLWTATWPIFGSFAQVLQPKIFVQGDDHPSSIFGNPCCRSSTDPSQRAAWGRFCFGSKSEPLWALAGEKPWAVGTRKENPETKNPPKFLSRNGWQKPLLSKV